MLGKNSIALLFGTLLGLFFIGANGQSKPPVVEKIVSVDSGSAQWRKCEGLPGCIFLPLRGDAKREASEALFQLDAGVQFPKHWHTSPEHLFVVQGTLVMNLENGERHEVGARSFLYNPGGMIHWGNCAQGEPCVYYVYDDKAYDIHLVE